MNSPSSGPSASAESVRGVEEATPEGRVPLLLGQAPPGTLLTCSLLFLVSVRDAAARLPNGEGTRAEICELLKDSQFLAPDVTSTQV